MNYRCLLAVTTLLGVNLACSPSHEPVEDTTEATPAVQPFPANFNYPQTAVSVLHWVSDRDGKSIREHGWYLWAGLNYAPSGVPVWRTWPTSTQTYAQGLKASRDSRALEAQSINAKNRSNASTEVADPINFKIIPKYWVPPGVKANYEACYIEPTEEQQKNNEPGGLKDGPQFEFNGDIMVAGVIYDQSAFNWIRSNRFYEGSTLTDKLPAKDAVAHIKEAPHAAMVLKPMLWPVKSTGFTALPVWDEQSPSADGGKYAGYEIKARWKRAVAVTPDVSTGPDEVPVEYLNKIVTLDDKAIGPVKYETATVTPISEFYHYQISATELDAMDDCDRAILDAAAQWSFSRNFEADDYLALIAMHIITKEQPSWTFQSVWWHDKPDEGRYASHRPTISKEQAPGPWEHYLMTSTYGMLQRPGQQNVWPTPLPPGAKKWPVAYNPYIELAAGHPIATNCMNCHLRAGWPSKRAPIDGRESSYLAAAPEGVAYPDSLDAFTINDPLFNGLLTLDAQWAMADRASVIEPIREE
jgi:hypothetical protein